MAEIQLDAVVDGPGTHALVVGVSNYPYLDGPQQTLVGKRFGVSNLSSAARSASEIANWLLTEYQNPATPLASLNVLLSPAAGEVVSDPTGKLAAVGRARRDEFEQAVMALAQRSKSPQSMCVVYVAGHGIQLTTRGAFLLLEDCGRSDKANELYGAADMAGLHGAFMAQGQALNQVWFVDACRQRPSFANSFEELAGAFTLSKSAIEKVDSSVLFLAASSREAAFAEIGGTTLFSQALLTMLRGAAAVGPDDVCDVWNVPVLRLADRLAPAVKKLAGAKQAKQQVDVTGKVNPNVVQRFARPPMVRFHPMLDPGEAAATARASLKARGATVLSDAPWPVDCDVAAGLYTLSVTTDPPFQPIDGWAVNLEPPSFDEPLRVST
ncbi:MAG: caspase family protein [Acidimicrobiia bacterium]|nr:caspase family protein [Acidimicrobiia bacterium]